MSVFTEYIQKKNSNKSYYAFELHLIAETVVKSFGKLKSQCRKTINQCNNYLRPISPYFETRQLSRELCN